MLLQVPDDPPVGYFETLYEHNEDSLRTRIIHPNGNEETFDYDSDNEDRRMGGNWFDRRVFVARRLACRPPFVCS